ncbi:hypothetical protein ABZS82_26360, partial [Streptomyces albidoflavus]
VKPLVYAEPANGITDSKHHVFLAEGALGRRTPVPASGAHPPAPQGVPWKRRMRRLEGAPGRVRSVTGGRG